MSALAVAFACLAGACLPARALASREDNSATRAYLHASYVAARGEYAQVRASVGAVEASAGQIAMQCPGVLTYAPRDAAFTEIGEEAHATLLYAGTLPLRTILMSLARAIGHLTWSDRVLTRLVRARLAEEATIVALAVPDLCAEIAAWKASDYAALPQGASMFVSRINAIEASSSVGAFEEPREVILRHLRRYEGRAGRAVAKRIEAFEARLARRMDAVVTAAQARLARALGVSAL